MDIFRLDIKYLILFGIFIFTGGFLISRVFDKIENFNVEQLTGIITLIAGYSFVLIIYERLLPHFFRFLQYFFAGADEKLFSSFKGEFLFIFSFFFGGFGYCFEQSVTKNFKYKSKAIVYFFVILFTLMIGVITYEVSSEIFK